MGTSDEALRFLLDLLSRMTVDCIDPEAEKKCRYIKEIVGAVQGTIGERSLKGTLSAALDGVSGFKKPGDYANGLRPLTIETQASRS